VNVQQRNILQNRNSPNPTISHLDISEVKKRMAGKLPQWSKLEGKADELAEREARRKP